MTMTQKSCNPVIERISGGGADALSPVEGLSKNKYLRSNKTLCLLVMYVVKIFMNFVPDSDLKQKLRTFKKTLFLNVNSYLVSDYCRVKKLKDRTYSAGNYKLSIVDDFYVNIYTDYSYIYDKDKKFLREISLDNKIVNIPTQKIKITKDKVIELDEAVNLALSCLFNFWHFTFQALDKMVALEEAGYQGKYLLFDKVFIKKLVKWCGIPEDKIIYVKNGEVYKVKKLHVIHECGKYDKNVLQTIKKRVLSNIDMSDLEKYPKKLFVRRIGYSRVIKNEDEIIEILKKYGFEMMFPDDYPLEEQIKYFHAADVVFTPHGANSTNALYMHEGSRFIECFGKSYVTPFMLDIIQDNKMSYNMLVEWNYADRIEDKAANYIIKPVLVEDTIYNL